MEFTLITCVSVKVKSWSVCVSDGRRPRKPYCAWDQRLIDMWDQQILPEVESTSYPRPALVGRLTPGCNENPCDTFLFLISCRHHKGTYTRTRYVWQARVAVSGVGCTEEAGV
jgi:hypothetical protein